MPGPGWRIYYADGSVSEGVSQSDWLSAPSDGVQVVVRFPRLQTVRWCYETGPNVWKSVQDRDLWTGTDVFDPFDWGPKNGQLISDAEYLTIWRRACGDD